MSNMRRIVISFDAFKGHEDDELLYTVLREKQQEHRCKEYMLRAYQRFREPLPASVLDTALTHLSVSHLLRSYNIRSKEELYSFFKSKQAQSIINPHKSADQILIVFNMKGPKEEVELFKYLQPLSQKERATICAIILKNYCFQHKCPTYLDISTKRLICTLRDAYTKALKQGVSAQMAIDEFLEEVIIPHLAKQYYMPKADGGPISDDEIEHLKELLGK